MGKVLIACEESQAVTKEMRALGIKAYSCDIEPCTGGHPEWHIKGDVIPLLDDDWAMIIAFPPCFVAGTLVLTKDGYRPIEKLSVGDYVLTHLNRWKQVTSTMSHVVAETIEVAFTGSSKIRTTKEHPFYISSRAYINHVKTETIPEWKNAGDLVKGDLSVFNLPPEERVYIPDGLLWLMGRYVADGHLRFRDGRYQEMQISIGKTKQKYFEDNCIYKFGMAEMRTAFRYSFYGKDFVPLFAQFGTKAENKTLPGWVLTLPKEQAAVFLDGYLSGDGYITDKRISASSVSKVLMVSMSVLMRRVYNRPTSINMNKRSPTTIIEGRVVNQKTSWVCYCSRGERTIATINGDTTFNMYRSSKLFGEDTVYNISVEDDESYIVDQCIVHNCTHLAVSGAAWFEQKRKDGRQQQGIDFFSVFINANCKRIAIENPVGVMSSVWRKPDQIIQPYEYGEPYSKRTCLWLKGLPKLVPTNIVDKGEQVKYQSGKSMPKWYADAYKLPPKERAAMRSKTFPGVARAMALQWGVLVK